MISVGIIRASAIGYYTSIAKESYYSEGGESPGRWQDNAAAKAFGLSGQVENRVLENLAYGYDPSGTYELVKNPGKDRRAAYDLCHSAPKSFSLVWAMASDPYRHFLESAFDRAADRTNKFVMDTAIFSRTGHGGYESEKVECLIASFTHRTSRALEPQYHRHDLFLNEAERADFSTGTLDGGRILHAKKVAGAFFRSALAEELGIVVERDPKQKFSFRIPGVSESLAEKWSSRTRDIEEELERLGEKGAKAKALIALSTRETKQHKPMEALFEEWAKTAHEYGFTEQEVNRILSEPRQELSPKAAKRLVDKSIDEVVKTLTERQSHFSKNALIADVCIATIEKAVSPTLIVERVEEVLETNRFVSLGNHRHQAHFTTHEIYHEVEGRALVDAARLTIRTHRPVKDERIEKALSNSKGPELNEGQRDVVYTVCQGPDLVLIQGPPGSGKSTSFRIVNQALSMARGILEQRGENVIGLCPTNKAAIELKASSGIDSYTVDRFILDREKTFEDKLQHKIEMLKRFIQGRKTWDLYSIPVNDKTTIVVDECSMADNAKLAKVLDIAWRTGARVALVGDHQQLASIGPGGLFRELWVRADDKQKASLTEIIRQQEGWNRKAIEWFGEGKVAEALAAFNQRGFLNVAESKEAAKDKLIDKWKEEALKAPNKSLILAATNEDVDDLNEKAQAARLEAGELSHRQVRIGEKVFRENDRIVWTESDKKRGIINNQFGTIIKIDRGTELVTVQVDKAEAPVVFSPHSFNGLKLSYAVTVHRAQSMTIDEDAFVLVGGSMQAKEMTYVQISRAKQKTHLFTDENTAGKDLSSLIEQISRSDAKVTAHTIARENKLDLSLHLSL